MRSRGWLPRMWVGAGGDERKRRIRSRKGAVLPGRAAWAMAATAAAASTLMAVGSSDAATAAVAAAQKCGGAPIKAMTIASLSGPLATFGKDIPNAAKAADDAANRGCSLGRPLDVTVCDDESTANGAAQCGTEAKQEGYLAIVGFTEGSGNSDQGALAAQLPAVFNAWNTAWDGDSKLSYSSWAQQAQAPATIDVAKALGVKALTLVGVDIAPLQLVASFVQPLTVAAGLGYTQVFFAPTTTDFSATAAQILADPTGAISIYDQSPTPLVDELQSLGANFTQRPMIYGEGIISPQVIASTSALSGAYDVGQVVSSAATSNPGIAQMRSQFKAAGIPFSSNISLDGVHEWNAVHDLAEALAGLKHSAIKSLTSATLVKAVVDHGLYNTASEAPFNFQKRASFTNPLLAKAYAVDRVYSTKYVVLQVHNGVEKPITGWEDENKTFTLNSGA